MHASDSGAEQSALATGPCGSSCTKASLHRAFTPRPTVAATDWALTDNISLTSWEPYFQLFGRCGFLPDRAADATLWDLVSGDGRPFRHLAVGHLTASPSSRLPGAWRPSAAALSCRGSRPEDEVGLPWSGPAVAAKYRTAQPALAADGDRDATAACRFQRQIRSGSRDARRSPTVAWISRFAGEVAGGSSGRACDGTLSSRLPVGSPGSGKEKGKQDGSRIRDRLAARRRAFSQLEGAQ